MYSKEDYCIGRSRQSREGCSLQAGCERGRDDGTGGGSRGVLEACQHDTRQPGTGRRTVEEAHRRRLGLRRATATVRCWGVRCGAVRRTGKCCMASSVQRSRPGEASRQAGDFQSGPGTCCQGGSICALGDRYTGMCKGGSAGLIPLAAESVIS